MKNGKTKLIYPEISYKIMGILFDVYNELGFGYQEKYYYKAIQKGLTEHKFKIKEQVPIPIKYRNEKIGIYYIDFLIDDCIVLEIK